MKLNQRILFIILLLALPIFVATTSYSEAKQTSQKTQSKTLSKSSKAKKSTAKKAPVKQADRFSALVVDANTGHILYEKNAGATRYPASLTKMMTLYLTFEALKTGKLDITDTLPVSAKAARQPQTNISLDAGDRLPVKTAIESLVVRSANDSSMVLAEALGGTEWNFALMMNKKARELGMKGTVFRNPNGLPNSQQVTTAYDMARIGIALRRDFPQYYPYFKLTEFTHNGITYPGHNRVMGRYSGVDGIKTGFINASGFNLVTSVKKNGYSLVAVIMGGSSGAARDNAMIDLLDKTFAGLASKQKNLAQNQFGNQTFAPQAVEPSAGGSEAVTTANAAVQ